MPRLPLPLPGRRSLLLLLVLFTLTACQINLVPTPTPVADAAEAEPPTVDPMAPLPLAQALPPEWLTIPALDLETPVTPMGWTVAEVAGERTTQWVVPEDAVGWHVTSAGAGGAGRVVLSGHQMIGSAPFAPLAQGALEPGMEIWLTDGEGIVFVYEVTTITEPIPLTGATPEEEAEAASYAAPTTAASLTLITGWPDFTTTHRVFAVAEFIGLLN
jgi:hypothetical protein